MRAAGKGAIFSAVQMLMAEAWRNERLINRVRIALFSVSVVVGGVLTTLILGRMHPAIWLMGSWALFVAIFDRTWFAKHYHPSIPWLMCAGEILIFGVGFLLARPIILANRPELADRQLGMLAPIFLFLCSINMLRFSWRLSLFCAGFSIATLLAIHLSLGTFDGLLLPMLLLLVGMGLVLAYTTRRFERLLHRQSIDLRRIQRERIASLRSLVAGVCHELNNPLGTLRSNAQTAARSLELLSDPAKAERAIAALNKIAAATEQATARIEKTVDSLKSFARLDEAEVKMTDVRTMIEDAVALLSADAIEVSKSYAELPPITCRPGGR